jgi:hypothetical protein
MPAVIPSTDIRFLHEDLHIKQQIQYQPKELSRGAVYGESIMSVSSTWVEICAD